MIERATTGRSGCHVCGVVIPKGGLRFVEGYPDKFDPEKTHLRFYDLRCASQRRPGGFGNALRRSSEEFPERPAFERLYKLWDEVLGDRARHEARGILADALQAIGDPRGELMAAQLLDPDGSVDSLIATHESSWLSSIRSYALAAQFRGGLVTRVELSDHGSINLHDDALEGVEDLLSGTGSGERYKTLLMALHRLRRVEVWDEDSLTGFEASIAALVHVGCGLWARNLGAMGGRFLRACADKPTLTSLAIGVEGIEAVMASPVFARLDAITLVVERLRDAVEIWPRLPRKLRVTITRSAKLPTLYDPPIGELVLDRTGNGVTVRACGEWARAGLIDHLPRATDRLVLVGASAEATTALRESARVASIELVAEPARPIAGVWRWEHYPDMPHATIAERDRALGSFIERSVRPGARDDARARFLRHHRIAWHELVPLLATPPLRIDELTASQDPKLGVLFVGTDTYRMSAVIAFKQSDEPWMFVADDGSLGLLQERWGWFRLLG